MLTHLYCLLRQICSPFICLQKRSTYTNTVNPRYILISVVLTIRDNDTCCQFHQRYTYKFFVRTSFSLVTFWLCQKNSYEKFACLMLMRLTPGFNFINVLRTTFMLVDPESVKNTVSHQYLFTLLGSTYAKAVRRTLMKLSPGVNFINVLCTAFTLVDPKSVKRHWVQIHKTSYAKY